MTTLIDALVVELGLDTSKFVEGGEKASAEMRKVEQAATRSADEIERRGGQAGEFFAIMKRGAVALSAAMAAIGVEKFMMNVAQMSSGLKYMAAGLDINVRDLSAWQNAVTHIANGTAAGVTATFTSMQANLEQLKFTGQSPIVPALRLLGIDPYNADGSVKSAEQIFQAVASSPKLASMSPTDKRFALQQAGINDQGMINFLLKPQTERDAELAHQREQTAMTEANVKAFSALNEAAIGLEQHFTSLATLLSVKAVPGLVQFIGGMDDILNVISGKMSLHDFVDKYDKRIMQPPVDELAATDDEIAKYYSDRAAKGGAEELGVTGPQYSNFRYAIAKIEGTPYNQMGGSNNRFAGRYQMGADEIAETAKRLGEPTPSTQDFLSDPAMQERYFNAYTSSHNEQLLKLSAKYRAMTPQQRLQVLAYAHNQGVGGAVEWMNTGVAKRDAFGTSGAAYADAVAARVGGGVAPVDPIDDMLAKLRAASAPVPSAANAASTVGAGGNVVTGAQTTTTNQTTIGSVVVHTQATDAKGIAVGIAGAIKSSMLATQANTGLA